jgi:FkbM family methyltransferase
MLVSRVLYYLFSIPTLLLGVKNWPKMIAVFLGLPLAQPIVITLRDGSRFQVRTLMDIWILKETCLERQYQHASVKVEDGWVVFDVGAGLGDFAISVARARPHSTVYAFEPFPESFFLLQENLRLNQIQNVRAWPHALSAQAGSTALHLFSPEAVQHTTVSRSDRAGSDVQVSSVTLDQVFSQFQLARCDYMKMDCEGAEYDILFNASDATLQKIKHVCLEYHEGVTEFSHRDLVQFFERHGFRVKQTPSPAHRHLGFLHAVNPSLKIQASTPRNDDGS